MRMSDFQNKDVVDILTGDKIGNVIDAEVSIDTGNILRLIVLSKRGLFGPLKKEEEFSILWGDIKKVGQDVILFNKRN